MGGIRSVCGTICILLLLWAQKAQNPAVNSETESNICVLRTSEGVHIRATMKPSLNTRDNLTQTLGLTNARCCLNLDKKCALNQHLNVTLHNIKSLTKYPIHPLWMVVNNKRIPHLGVWDELWYSFYHFGEPLLVQTVDVRIARKTSSNSGKTFSVHLSSEDSASPPKHTETSAYIVIDPHRSSVQEEDRIIPEDVFLLIPEMTDHMKKDSQTRRGPRDYLVLHQTLFKFPNTECFDQKTLFLSLVNREHRPCVEASTIDLEEQPYDFYVKERVKEINNRPTEFFLSSFGTLHDTINISRYRSSIDFISKQPVIIQVFVPNDEKFYTSSAAEFLNTLFATLTIHIRHLGSFLNDQLCLIIDTIRETCAVIFKYFDTLCSRHLGPFLTDLWTQLTSISHEGYDVIAKHLQFLTTILNEQWTSAVGALNAAAEHLCDVIADKIDQNSIEKSIDHQLNMIWMYVSIYIDHACQVTGLERTDSDITVAVAWISFCVFIVFPLLLVKWLVTSLRNTEDVQEIDGAIMLANDNDIPLPMFIREDPVLAEFMQEAFNIMFLPPPWADEDNNMVDNTNNAVAGQQIVLWRSTGIPSIRSDLSLSMGIAYDDDDVTLLRPTVTDPLINYWFARATANNYHQVLLANRANSESEIMYLTQRRTEFGSFPTSRDQSLITGRASEEYNRLASHQIQSLPCITNVEERQHNQDVALVERIGSSSDVMSAARRQSKTSVVEPPTGENETGLKHNSEDSSEEDQGTDLDQVYNIYKAQKGSVPSILLNHQDLKQSMTDLHDDIDDTQGSPSHTAIHLSARNERPVLDEAHQSRSTQNRSDPIFSREDKDLQKLMKDLITDTDNTYGPPSPRSSQLFRENQIEEVDSPSQTAINIPGNEEPEFNEAQKSHTAQNKSAPIFSREDKDLQKLMKNLITDVDETYGPPSRCASDLFGRELSKEDEETDIDDAHQIPLTPKRSAPTVSQTDNDFKIIMGKFIANIDETYGPPSPRSSQLFSENQIEEVNREAWSIQSKFRPNHIAHTRNIKMSPKTNRQRLTNFLWGCQEILLYIFEVYRNKQIL